jgi:hypothetical protein
METSCCKYKIKPATIRLERHEWKRRCWEKAKIYIINLFPYHESRCYSHFKSYIKFKYLMFRSFEITIIEMINWTCKAKKQVVWIDINVAAWDLWGCTAAWSPQITRCWWRLYVPLRGPCVSLRWWISQIAPNMLPLITIFRQDYWSFLKGSKRYWSHIGTEKGSESERCHASLPNSWDFEEKFSVDEEWILHIINLNCQRRIVLSLHNLKPLWCNSFEHIKEFGNIPSQKWTSIGEVGMLPLEYKFSQTSSTQPADEQVLKVL